VIEQALARLDVPVRILAAGGTISMTGDRATPTLDAAALVELVPSLSAVAALEAETVLELPGVHLDFAQAVGLARRAAEAAAEGMGVVVTTGTDTLEEVAVLCALVHDASAPIVLTGAGRPASAPGADGAVNIVDAVAVAGDVRARGLGVVVVFGGEIHDAMTVCKVDSTGPSTFGSPATGPLGRVVDGRLWLHTRPSRRPAALDPVSFDHRVDILSPALGDGGELLRDAATAANGLVITALGAGHLPPRVAAELRRAARRIPVVVTCRPHRSAMLFDTYGFEGAESDVRASGAICAPFLSPPAARMVLLSCLAAGLDREGVAAILAPWDANAEEPADADD
jgi:L-asparaginase